VSVFLAWNTECEVGSYAQLHQYKVQLPLDQCILCIVIFVMASPSSILIFFTA